MRTPSPRFLGLSALLLCLLLLAIFIGLKRVITRPTTTQLEKAIPDFFAKNFLIVQTNENGLPKNILRSSYAEHYPKTEMIYFSTPSVTVYPNAGALWQISAQHGKTWGKHIDKIYLWEEVIISRPKDKNIRFSTLTTTEIYYYPPTKIAYTDKPVTITQPGTLVKSIGLQANFNTGIINLLSQARGHYVPKEPHQTK